MAIRIKFVILISTVAVITATVCYIALPVEFIFDGPGPEEIAKLLAPKYARILFVGDLMFDRGIRYYAGKNGGNDFIFERISPLLMSEDLVIANLEGPITSSKSVSAGTVIGSPNNYYFTFDPSVAEALFNENIRLVDLGNNHILNFGRDGLSSTKQYLDRAGVGYFGAPDYPKSVSEEIGGVKITFISYNEFSALQENMEELSTLEEIQKAKGYSDIIIVFSHWGAEYSLIPGDLQKELAHKLINAGADLVVGSHQHVIQPMEEYNGKRIYYSLGNFIFDQYFDENVRKGLGVEVKINKKTKQFEFSEKRFYLESNGQTSLK